MKKVFVSMLALAALASCSSEEVLNEEVDNGQRVPITLKAGVVQVETKAAVEADANGKLTADLSGVVFYKSESTKDGSMVWDAKTTTHSATIKTDGSVTFDTPIYYPAKEDTYAFLVGVYPSDMGTADAANKTITIGDANFTGQQDIMYAAAISGNKKTTVAPSANFAHKLSQLKFTLKKGTGYDATKTVKSITVNGTCKPTVLNLETGDLTCATTASPLTITNNQGTEVTEAGAAFSETVLIGVVQTGASITLDIELSDGTKISDVAVSNINSPVANTSYNIDLTFKQAEITANAIIAPWQQGTNGEGTVQ